MSLINPGAVLLASNALLLGFRHGIDWDHIAAVMDMASTTAITDENEPLKVHRKTLVLSLVYALGHTVAVLCLAVLAMSISAKLPAWLESSTQRAVGITLMLFGGWVCFLIMRSLKTGEPLAMQSRGNIILGTLRKTTKWLLQPNNGQPVSDEAFVVNYGYRTAFGIGIIHGAGAETATQVMLIYAVGTAASKFLGLLMIANFSLGFIISIFSIAFLSAQGFTLVGNLRPLYISLAAVTAIFSIVIGCLFLSGSAILPAIAF